MTLSGTTTSGQSEPGSNGNEGVLRIPQSSIITGASPSYCLVSLPGHSLGKSYFYAAPTNRDKKGKWLWRLRTYRIIIDYRLKEIKLKNIHREFVSVLSCSWEEVILAELVSIRRYIYKERMNNIWETWFRREIHVLWYLWYKTIVYFPSRLYPLAALAF